MINLEFKFKHGPRLIRNEYILTVDYMHGDADGYTTKEHTYSDSEACIEQLKLDVLGLITYIKTDSEFDETDVASELTPIFEAQGIQNGYDVAEEWVDNFSETDITCEDRNAALTGYSLVYYDDSGDRFEVELYINGKLVE